MCCEETKPIDQNALPHVIGWRAWYADGAVYCCKTIDWVDLPDDGVLFVKLYYDTGGARVMSGSDFYFQQRVGEDYIYAQNTIGPLETLEDIQRRYPSASIKRGKWVTDTEMHRVDREAMAEEF